MFKQLLTFAAILAAYIRTYPKGKIIFAEGAEGSGKSTFIELLLDAAPGLVTAIYFSKTLDKFLGSEFCIREFHVDQILKARAQMKARDKNIDERIVTFALKHAVAAAKKKGFNIIICDGFPRMDWQCEKCEEIFQESFPEASFMLLHADCPLEEAFRRCVEYRGDNPETIRKAHEYYTEHGRGVINLASSFATYVTVYTGGSKEETATNLLDALNRHCRMATRPKISSSLRQVSELVSVS